MLKSEKKEFSFESTHSVPDLSIFLVGMMGSGKTTLGRALARTLSRQFVDLDQQLEERCGVDVPFIFEMEGEAGFRRRESAMLAQCTEYKNVVLATGGGAVLDPNNRRLLRQRGIVIYLCAEIEELFLRTRSNQNRPLLADPNPQQKLSEIIAFRDPIYREVADLIVNTTAQSIQRLVKLLLLQLESFEK